MKVKHSYGILRRMVATIVIIVTTTSVNAHSVVDVSGIVFGTSYEEALQAIEEQFGKPLSRTESRVVYRDKDFMGVRFQELTFGFQKDDEGRTYFNEARFTLQAGSKANACKYVETIANRMADEYPGVSKDLEEDGSPFYKGGASPFIGNYLFTIYVYPGRNGYQTVLRYGPLPYVK